MEIVITSIVAFASTNIDDIFLLILFFGDRKFKPFDIYLGQYVGVIALVIVSIIGSLIGNFIDPRYVGLLGLFPIYLGIRKLIEFFRNDTSDPEIVVLSEKKVGANFLAVAAVTIANGGDNIGTYIPLFVALTIAQMSIMIGIFLVMIFIWLLIAHYLTNHPILAKAISTYGHIATPVVLCLLGIFILHENGSFGLLFKE
jgi:cadmium resistance transport/sequestration family protein